MIYPEGPQIGRTFLLPLHEVIVGREKGCAVHIESESISRWHARIHFNGDAWVVEDLQSTNGCFVNDMPVAKSVLRDADMLKIGSVIFKFSAACTSEIPSGADEGEGGGGAPALLGTPRPRSRN
jgi:pSer/pThr/pTyr-binding forkhead associated (FHA) protein